MRRDLLNPPLNTLNFQIHESLLPRTRKIRAIMPEPVLLFQPGLPVVTSTASQQEKEEIKPLFPVYQPMEECEALTGSCLPVEQLNLDRKRRSTPKISQSSQAAPYESILRETSRSSESESPKHRGYPSEPVRIVVAPYSTACSERCGCICHRRSLIRTPSGLFENILGRLSMNTAGFPLLSCNELQCRGRKNQIVKVRYSFPRWFLARAIAFNVSQSAEGPMLWLLGRRVLGPNARLFQYARKGDMTAMEELLQKRVCSPADIDPRSWTALHVSNTSLLCYSLL